MEDRRADDPQQSTETAQDMAEKVYGIVREMVMDAHLEPGARVTIDRLAREIGVSQTPIREALARLEADGLVTRSPRRGYLIAPLLGESAFESLYELRMLVEPFAASRSAELGTDELVETLTEYNAQMRRIVAGLSDGTQYHEYQEFAAVDAQFHDAIAEACGNTLLPDVMRRYKPHTHLYRLYFDSGIGVDTVPEHNAIVDAIRRHRPDDARAAMITHLDRSRNRLLGTVRRATGLPRAVASTDSVDDRLAEWRHEVNPADGRQS